MNLLSESASPLFTKEIVFSFFAFIGGAVVLIGLLMEWKSAKRDEGEVQKEWFSNINEFRRRNHKSHVGEFWVIWGVIIEIIVGVVFAASDVNEKFAMNNQNAKNNPLNQSIASARARVVIEQKGTNTSTFDLKANDISFAGFVSLKLFSSKQPTNGIFLICKSVNNFVAAGPNNWWELEFEEDIVPDHLAGFGTLPDVKSAINCDEVFLKTPFLRPIETKLLGGHVTININDKKLEFDIPPQQVGIPSTKHAFPVTVQW